MRVLVVGKQQAAAEPEFWPELRERATVVSRGTENDVVLFFADTADHLIQLSLLRERIVGTGAIWVIYPKGVKSIRETDVIAAGKDHRLVDNKIAGFSDTHSAMRLVIPVRLR
jgi:hypothetical protein